MRCNALQTWAHELEGVFSFHEGAKDALQAAEINAFSEASTAPGHGGAVKVLQDLSLGYGLGR